MDLDDLLTGAFIAGAAMASVLFVRGCLVAGKEVVAETIPKVAEEIRHGDFDSVKGVFRRSGADEGVQKALAEAREQEFKREIPERARFVQLELESFLRGRDLDDLTVEEAQQHFRREQRLRELAHSQSIDRIRSEIAWTERRKLEESSFDAHTAVKDLAFDRDDPQWAMGNLDDPRITLGARFRPQFRAAPRSGSSTNQRNSIIGKRLRQHETVEQTALKVASVPPETINGPVSGLRIGGSIPLPNEQAYARVYGEHAEAGEATATVMEQVRGRFERLAARHKHADWRELSLAADANEAAYDLISEAAPEEVVVLVGHSTRSGESAADRRLHLGGTISGAGEGPTLQELHEFAASQGKRLVVLTCFSPDIQSGTELYPRDLVRMCEFAVRQLEQGTIENYDKLILAFRVQRVAQRAYRTGLVATVGLSGGYGVTVAMSPKGEEPAQRPFSPSNEPALDDADEENAEP